LETIAKLREFERAVKKSFSNVRADILTIKDYLEKQHDLINQDISELQSQIFEMQRLVSKTNAELENKYYEKSAAKKGTKSRSRIHKQLRTQIDSLNSQLSDLNKKVKNIENKKVSESKLNKTLSKVKRSITALESDIESNYVEISKNIKSYKRSLSKKTVKKTKSKKQKGPGLFVTLFSKRTPKPVKKRKAKPKRKSKKKKKKNIQVIPILIIFFAVILLGVGIWYIYNNSPIIPPAFENETGTQLPTDMTILEVYETDFVNIMPNMSDPDQDKLTYIFGYPLNKSGQWQTQKGDAGQYSIVISVSDGQSTTEMEFLLIVLPKQ